MCDPELEYNFEFYPQIREFQFSKSAWYDLHFKMITLCIAEEQEWNQRDQLED